MTANHAQHIARLMDLTNLNPSATTADINALCDAAAGPWGQVAGICVWSRFVPFVRRKLERTNLRQMEVCTVVNFPEGKADTTATVREIRSAILLGATEIDLVFPYHAFLSGNQAETTRFLSACRAACPVTLKVILETGVLERAEVIHSASLLAMAQGADFLKTSTGRAAVHATPEAAQIMFHAVRETGSRTGVKISGGLRQYADALAYLELAKNIMGEDWISPHTLRFGASSLLSDLLSVMEKPCAGSA